MKRILSIIHNVLNVGNKDETKQVTISQFIQMVMLIVGLVVSIGLGLGLLLEAYAQYAGQTFIHR
jgi:hypothetical protein